ncbi:MAG TPA: SAF domain-containing protein [Candidatus Sulfopaludibacter sp.]|jgi:hypothetical protein|nr:SAF domain-containing protein [Candidatus Sulfopaludibacter sp.]
MTLSLLLTAAFVLVVVARDRIPAAWHVLAAILAAPLLLSWVAALTTPPADSPAPAWHAARPLPVNTRLTAGDLRKPDFPAPVFARGIADVSALAGKYLRRARQPNDSVWPTDVADSPDLAPPPETALLFFPAQTLGAARPYVNAGSKVYICEDAKPCAGPSFPIQAIVGADSGSIAVAIPRTEIDRIRAIAKPTLFPEAL